jgi:6-phosphofructokinase 2
MVALTMGPAGALIATKKGVVRAAAIKVDARSTVGAGDSFLAALMLAFAEDRPIDDCLTRAVAGGAAAVLHPGTKLCSRADALRLYKEACLQPVK